MRGGTIARRFLIQGRVQGVGFRWFVVEAASRLGVAGWTRNLPDGRVEVLAQGASDAVGSLASSLGVGPRGARVERVEALDESPDPALRGFDVRF